MAMRVALAGDTMLGRSVADALDNTAPSSLVEPEVAELMRSADVCVLNLECCVSARGEPRLAPGKPFYFRAPPRAVELLSHLGVDCVTLANNHALDFGEVALLDTLDHLEAAGIASVGAGWDDTRARTPATVRVGDELLTIIGFTDHPADCAAGPRRPGVAYVDLRAGLDPWVTGAVSQGRGCVLVTPHWGPNMVAEPRPIVRAVASRLSASGASLVAGHSAHVFHGVGDAVVYDMGDFLDDYRVDPLLRNDLGLLFLVEVRDDRPRRLEAVPLELAFCRTGLAHGEQAAWIRRRFAAACAAFGQDVTEIDGRLVVTW